MRKTSTALCAVASLVVALPLTAQDHTWDRERPDGHAPLGLLGDVTLDKGQLMFTYRYSRDSFAGLRSGPNLVSFDDVFGLDFTTIPALMDTQAHEAEIRYGLSDDLSISAMVPFTFKEMTNLISDGDEFYITESNDLGDIHVRVLYDLFEIGEYRAHASLGGSIPTGELNDRDLTPETFPNVTQLPFAMQNGSGTYDLMPGLGFSAQNETGTVGAATEAVIRFGDNDRGYTLGDRYMGTVWASYMMNSWVSISARVHYETWEDIAGTDPDTNGSLDLSANPFATGGSRTTLPLGVNVMLNEGPFEGIRMAVEWHYVISEDLNGTQLSQEDRIYVGFQIGS